jgi:hypothetical protein
MRVPEKRIVVFEELDFRSGRPLEQQTIVMHVAVEVVEVATEDEEDEEVGVVSRAGDEEDEGTVVMRMVLGRSDEASVVQRVEEAVDAATDPGPAESRTLLRSASRAMQPSTWRHSRQLGQDRPLRLLSLKLLACVEMGLLDHLVRPHPCHHDLWVKHHPVPDKVLTARGNRFKAGALRCLRWLPSLNGTSRSMEPTWAV